MAPKCCQFKCVSMIVIVLTFASLGFLEHNWNKEVLGDSQVSLLKRVQFALQLKSTVSSDDRKPKDEWMDFPIPKRTQLIILGYKTSGSSLAGAVITSHREVYYSAYEPIWYIKDADVYGVYASDRTIPLSERIKTEFLELQNPPEPLDMIKALHNCRLNKRLRSFIMYAGDSKEITWLDECLETKSKTKPQTCYSILNERCRQAKLTAMKTVRLSMSEAEELLREDPDMKIVHVIRDPRGTSNSELSLHENVEKAAEEYIQIDRKEAHALLDERRGENFTGEVTPLHMKLIAHCRILTEDLQKSLQISSKYKGRILTIRYEDLAEEPYRISTRLLNLLGLGMKPEVEQTIHDLMETGEKKAETRGYIIKANSSAHASKWRGQIALDVVGTIQRDCGFVFKVLGYRLFSSEAELRNLYFPDRDKDYDHRLLKVI